MVCEKPFARDADEARRMLDAAEAAGVVHLLGTEFRFATSQALVARLIAEGTVGRAKAGDLPAADAAAGRSGRSGAGLVDQAE